METLQIVGSDKLEAVIKESGLQVNDGAEIKSAYLPFLEELAEIVQESSKINFEKPAKLDEEIAGKLRKRAVKIRTASESKKDDRKKIILIRGNLETASNNVVKNTSLLIEESFRVVEEYSERQQAQKKLALKNERTSLLQPYCENPELYPLGDLSEGAFNDLLSGFRLQKEAREKAESDRLEALRLEEERKEKEREIDFLTNDRKYELASNYHYTYSGEKRLGEMSESEYEVIVKMASDEYDLVLEEQERIRKDNERLQNEAKAKAKEIADERKRQDALLLAEKQKADKLKADNDAKLKAEQAHRKKIEDELKERQAQEEKARQEALKQEKEKLAAEKKAAKQPDKIKLTKWVDSFVITDIPTGISNESGTIGLEISNKFDSFKTWAKNQIETL